MDPRAALLVELPAGDPLTLRAVLDHHYAGLLALGALPDEAREWLGREHYFRTWDNALAHGDRIVDRRFEAAADSIVAGDRDTLARLLGEDPALARARSGYGHRQTLLQHVAANGIEWARQWQTPANAVELAQLLLAAGAEPDATCDSYAPTNTAMNLLCSSAHPAEARLQGALVETLVTGGAAVDGPDNDSDPLWTATIWGYQDAVDALVRCGARLDNVVLAAAAGDVERTRALLTAPPTPLKLGALDKTLPAEHLLEYALIYAASLDRRDVVAELLAHGPDLTIRDPVWDATALDTASHAHPAAGRPHGNPVIVALLKAHRT